MAGNHDQRDRRTWVVLELTRLGEIKVEEGVLASLIRKSLHVDSDFPVFIPSVSFVVGAKRTTIHLMEGYAFVASGLPETTYINLEGIDPYVKKILTSKGPSGMRVLSVVPESSILEMRTQLAQHVSSDVAPGMPVLVTEGVYTNLEGNVIDVNESDAHVRFTLRSIEILTVIPRVFLAPIDSTGGL